MGRGPGYRLDISGFNPREARLEDQLKLGDGLTYTSSNHITHGMSFSARFLGLCRSQELFAEANPGKMSSLSEGHRLPS